MKQVKLLCIIAVLGVTAQLTWAQGPLATWTFTNAAGDWGSSPSPATAASNDVTVGGLTRGSGLTTPSGAAANSWGGAGFSDGVAIGSQTAATSVANGNYFTFTLAATPGNSMSLSQISPYNVRRSTTTGPGLFRWQYSLDGTSFTDIGGDIPTGSTSIDPGNPQSGILLNGIADLQNVPSSTTVTFRVVAWGATGLSGAFYFNSGAATNQSLIINGTVTPSAPLPLTLVSFKGQSENNTNILNWVTVNEENVARFELERGTNGHSFDKIATLAAKGRNTATNSLYTYEDATAGTVAYYRLKMVDKDDKANYSDIVVLRKETVQNNVNVYPNPAEGTLFVEGMSNNSSYRVTDALGREVISATVAESTAASVNVSGLVQGIYFLQLTDANGATQAIRFVKK